MAGAMRRSAPADHADCAGLRSRPRRLLAGALACGAWNRGSRDPCLECRGIGGASASENRPARHRVAEARVLGVAAWRTGPLQHGARAHDCRRGRQAAEPRARLPGGGTHADCEPDKVHPGPAGHRNLKPTLRKAAERLATVRTPESMPLPPNTLAELQRDMARLGFVVSQIREIEETRQKRLEQETETGPHAMVRQVARVIGIGIETADMLVHEVLSRPMRDRKAVARYAGLTGSPDESGARRREQGLARAGNARGRRGMIQLAWRFLMFQKKSALALWYRTRTADSRIGTRKTMIVALARKLIIALWRFVTTGDTLEGDVLRPAG